MLTATIVVVSILQAVVTLVVVLVGSLRSNTMNDNVLYELVVEKNHLNLIKQSLSLQINNLYEAVDADVVNTEKAYEDIKVLSDMLAVLRNSDSERSSRVVKQTSQTTGLIWVKEVFAPQETPEPFEPFNDENLQYTNEVLQQAWNNVKERHWDTIKRMGEK